MATMVDAARRSGRRLYAGFSLEVTAWLLVAIGLWMAAMPFVGSIIGIPFDGEETWALNRNRLLLHVLPGLLGAGLGLVLLRVARRHERDGIAYPGWTGAVALAAVGVATWNALGPWLMDALMPATAEESALMFQSIPGFEGFSSLHQLVLEVVCHGMPGLVTLVAALSAIRISRTLTSLERTA